VRYLLYQRSQSIATIKVTLEITKLEATKLEAIILVLLRKERLDC